MTKRLIRIPYIIVIFSLIFQGCTDKETPDPVDNNPPPGPAFKGPVYPDDYTPVASWNDRDKWNLANVHDPSVVKDGEYYYMYQTNASYGNAHDGHGFYPYRRSKDLVEWEFMGMAFSATPAWVKDSMNNNRARMGLEPIENPRYGYWAPCVRKIGDNKFRMYYSLIVDELIEGNDFSKSWGERPYIGLAETDDLESNVWVDKGMAVTSAPDGKETYTRSGEGDWSSYYKFNAIDPSLVITPEGEHWLFYGSWMTGIAAVQLDPATGKPFELNEIEDYGIRIAGRGSIETNRWQALEGPEIIYIEETGYYYLFLAYDELSVAYNTRVARSKNISGPYRGFTNQNVTNGADCWPMLTHPYAFNNHPGWVGFSHCAIFQDEASKKWFYASQARLPDGVPGINASNAIMMGHVRELKWTDDGWPVASPERYAGVPDTVVMAEDVIGTWEQIKMEYQYQTIQTSESITLEEDGSLSGAASGSWALDEANQTLTINGVKCQLFSAWDWEANTRKVTLAYSGYTSTGRPVWGKKIN